MFAPIAILAALYYRIAEFAVSIPFSGCALLLASLFAVATENLCQAPAASRFGRGKRAVCHRRHCGAGACAHHGAGKRMADGGTCAGRAGRRLGFAAASPAGTAHACRRRRRHRSCAHCVGAAHCRRQCRHHAHLQLVALRLWRSRCRFLVGRLSSAPPRAMMSRAHDRFRRDRVDGAARLS